MPAAWKTGGLSGNSKWIERSATGCFVVEAEKSAYKECLANE